MLKIVKHMGQLSFSALMEVYEESNRKTAREEWPTLPEWAGIQNAEQDFHQYLREVFFKIPDAVYVMGMTDNRYVSALRLEPYRDGLLIEALETAPDHRRKGYGRMLLLDVITAFPGKKLYSHVDKRNEASLSLHKSCGFEKTEDFAVYIDGSVNYRGYTLVRNP